MSRTFGKKSCLPYWQRLLCSQCASFTLGSKTVRALP